MVARARNHEFYTVPDTYDPAVIRKILALLALGHSGPSPGPAPLESGAAAS